MKHFHDVIFSSSSGRLEHVQDFVLFRASRQASSWLKHFQNCVLFSAFSSGIRPVKHFQCFCLFCSDFSQGILPVGTIAGFQLFGQPPWWPHKQTLAKPLLGPRGGVSHTVKNVPKQYLDDRLSARLDQWPALVGPLAATLSGRGRAALSWYS